MGKLNVGHLLIFFRVDDTVFCSCYNNDQVSLEYIFHWKYADCVQLFSV